VDTVILVLQGIFVVIAAIWTVLAKPYSSKYLEEKGKNLATKQDVEEITQKIEGVKADIAKAQSINQAKFQLKHEACLEALALIDAHFSQVLKSPDGVEASKQYSTAEKARVCHSKLILSCEDTKVLEKFAEIMFGPKTKHQEGRPLTDLLNEFRNLIRHELGFGAELQLDRERAWFGRIISEKQDGQ
jgi:hypothetical protein